MSEVRSAYFHFFVGTKFSKAKVVSLSFITLPKFQSKSATSWWSQSSKFQSAIGITKQHNLITLNRYSWQNIGLCICKYSLDVSFTGITAKQDIGICHLPFGTNNTMQTSLGLKKNKQKHGCHHCIQLLSLKVKIRN